MNYLPVCISLDNKNILIIGAGRIAFQKIRILVNFTDNITVLSPEISDDVANYNLKTIKKHFEPSDLEGYDMVYSCTNNRHLNEEVSRVALEKKLLVNIVDFPGFSNFISPAIYRQDHMTVSVSSSGRDVKKSVQWRNKIKEFMENDPTGKI